MSKQYDQIFRENLQEIFPQVLAAFNDTEYRQVKPLPTTLVKTLQREPDFLFEIVTDQGKQLLHVDVQTKYDAAMHRRMYLYSALLFDKYRLPVKQIVLYIGGGTKSMTDSITMGDFTYRYQLIDFRQIPYQNLLKSTKPALVLFAILGDFGKESAEKALTAIVTRLKQTAKNDKAVFMHLRMLADLRNLGTLIEKLQTEMALDIKDSDTSLYKKGKQEGEEGKREMIRNLLRMGYKPEDIAKAAGMKVEEIRKLADN
ncbi:MAG: hypothetical protein MUD08_17515 [Cytophagales bacterium]|jgi:predicted transposase YdaD|nr:hypothetical protein [Cytophagales bacterium]